MKKYNVEITSKFIIEVLADSRREAIRMTKDTIENSDLLSSLNLKKEDINYSIKEESEKN